MKHGRSDYQHIQDKTGKIPENEPVFLIRAQNPYSGAAVRAWAKLHDAANGDPRCSDQARILAREMDNWPTKKVADYPGQRPEEGKYVATIPPEEVEADDRKGDLEEAVRAAVTRIHELEGLLGETRAHLDCEVALKVKALEDLQARIAAYAPTPQPEVAAIPGDKFPSAEPSGRQTTPIAPGSLNT